MTAYEIVYILDAALDLDAVNAKLDTFHARLGGEVTTVDHWGVRRLVYPVNKAEIGYFVVAHVSAEPSALPEFERLLKLDEETMRYLVVLNHGQPTSGASVFAERPVVSSNPEREETPDRGEVRESQDRDEEAKPVVVSAPPVYSGVRGRRRRFEGPPVVLLNYKDVATLSRFLTEQGKILPKRTTKVTARFQRRLGTAIKRARYLALLPYTKDHLA